MATPTALASATSSPPTAGAFQDALGNVLKSGRLTFDLSQAGAIAGGGELAPVRVSINLDINGKVAAGQAIFRNTDLTPSGTTYQMQAFDGSGNFAGNWGAQVISGAAPIDLAALVPTSIGGGTVGFANAVVQNPTAPQAINGQPLTMEGALLGFSAAGATTPDTGLSRTSPGQVSLGNGNQGDRSGAFAAATYQVINSGQAAGISSNGTAGIVAIGNATTGDTSGTVFAAGINIQGAPATALPATIANRSYLIGAAASPVSATNFIGDGTGWQYWFAKRAGSVNTNTIGVLDTGVLIWPSSGTTVDTGVSRNAANVVAIGNGTQGDTTGSVALGGANAAQSGAVRVANNTNAVVGRNALNSGDISLLAIGGGNQIAVGGFGSAQVININGNLQIGGAADTGFSRTSAATMALGNGTQGSSNGNLILSQTKFVAGTGSISVNGQGGQTTNVSWNFPVDVADTFAGVTATQTLTNKTITGLTPSSQVFTGNGTFTIPTGITTVKVTVIGGGGAGGGGNLATDAGCGGAGAGTTIKWLSSLTPGNTLTVTVGGGGVGVSAGAGNAGGISTVASGTQTISTITANAGQGGTGPGGTGTAGAAVGSGGDINSGGGAGQIAQASQSVGGLGGASSFGGGGLGGVSGANGGNGLAIGSGGGGGGGLTGNTTGGSGATGIAIFEWVK